MTATSALPVLERPVREVMRYGVVAVPEGLLATLERREVAVVIAHELGHIRHRDTLIIAVAATLAATLVAYKTVNRAGAHLLDDRMLNVVLALMLCTAILGPVLTEHFAPRLVKEKSPGGGQDQPMREAA